jgi:hypothetical protein
LRLSDASQRKQVYRRLNSRGLHGRRPFIPQARPCFSWRDPPGTHPRRLRAAVVEAVELVGEQRSPIVVNRNDDANEEENGQGDC